MDLTLFLVDGDTDADEEGDEVIENDGQGDDYMHSYTSSRSVV